MHSRSTRGLTLIEILVVIALLGLILVAIIVSLSPGDDQRVQKEAERLAAYLLGASAEAKMLDGPVRVAFSLDDQRYAREAGRVGADVTTSEWLPDKKVRRQTVGKPVRLTELNLPLVGEMTNGRGWMVWDGVRTGGGVAILELNSAVWSVVVDPRSGEITVERGRAKLPERAVARRSRFSLGDDALARFSGPGSDVLDAPDLEDLDAGLPPIPAFQGLRDPEPDNNNQPEDDYDGDLPPEDDEDGFLEPELDEPEEDPYFDAGFDPDAGGPPDADVVCSTDDDCRSGGDPARDFHRCYKETPESEGQCLFDPAGMDLRVSQLNVTQPEQLAGALNLALSTFINDGSNHIVFSFPYGNERPGESWRGPVMTTLLGAYVAQAVGNASSPAPNIALPSFSLQPTSMAFCPDLANGNQCDYTLIKVDQGLSGTTGRIEMYLKAKHPVSNSPCYVRLVLPSDKTNIQLSIKYSGRWMADVVFQALLKASDADSTEFPVSDQLRRFVGEDIDGDFVTLRDIFKLMGLGDPVADTNGDGIADAWQMSFQGQAELTNLRQREALTSLLDRNPSGTCSDED